MNSGEERAFDLSNNPGIGDTIDRFLKCADYEFECSEIVGRGFETIDDHAGYLRDGCCSEVIEVLAEEVKNGRQDP